jgi:hypothetical protein
VQGCRGAAACIIASSLDVSVMTLRGAETEPHCSRDAGGGSEGHGAFSDHEVRSEQDLLGLGVCVFEEFEEKAHGVSCGQIQWLGEAG